MDRIETVGDGTAWREDGTAPGSGVAGWAIVGAALLALVVAVFA